jgi:hypothetical protein
MDIDSTEMDPEFGRVINVFRSDYRWIRLGIKKVEGAQSIIRYLIYTRFDRRSVYNWELSEIATFKE